MATSQHDERPLLFVDIVPLLVLGTVLGLANLWRGFYFLEYAGWGSLTLPFGTMMADRLAQGHLPGYYALLHWWWQLFNGESTVAMRMPGVLMMLVSLYAFIYLAYDIGGRRVALMAGAMFAIHQSVIWSAQTMEPGIAWMFCSVLGLWGLVRWLARGQEWGAAAVFGAALLGLLVHPMHGATLVVQLVVVAWAVRRAPGRALVAALAIGAAVLAAWPVLRMLVDEQQVFHAKDFEPRFKRLADGIARVYLGQYDLILSGSILQITTQAIIIAHVVGLAGWLSQHPAPLGETEFFKPRGVLIASWLVVPLTALLVADALLTRSFVTEARHFVAIVPAMILMATLATLYWRDRLAPQGRLLRRLPYLIFVLMGLYSVAWLLQSGDGPRVVAGRMGTPSAVVGDAWPLYYEYRRNPVPYYPTTAETLEGTLAGLHGRHPHVWFVVYDNKANPLDRFLTETPGGWEVMQHVEFANMRAVQLKPIEPQAVIEEGAEQ